jgi:predicted ester cyclase
VRLRRVVAIDGEMAVTEHTLSGTHSGPLYGVAPTARFVYVDTAVIWEFDGERVRGETVYFDLATMLRQTGTLTMGTLAPLGRQEWTGFSRLLPSQCAE